MRHCGTQVKANIMLVDYRGYGMSDGSPSQAGLLLDAQVCALVLWHVAYNVQHTHSYLPQCTHYSFLSSTESTTLTGVHVWLAD